MSHEKSEAESSANGTRLFTARYLAERVLTGGGVVPVGVSMRPPLIPLPYGLEETARSLVPEPWMAGQWPWLSPTYWGHLDGQGVAKIGKELKAIGERHGGKPLALLDQEDTTKGHRSLRVVFAAWWEANAGEAVPELLDDGQTLHYSQLHRRTRPKRPKDPREDRRWTDDVVLGWPISHGDFERWARGRHWQFARTRPQNPHWYTHRSWATRRRSLGSLCTYASTAARSSTAATPTRTMSRTASSTGRWALT